MVAISTSGSGEGPGWATGRAYSTAPAPRSRPAGRASRRRSGSAGRERTWTYRDGSTAREGGGMALSSCTRSSLM